MGVLLCLLALVVSVKPLANVTANHACYDRNENTGEDFQSRHLLSVARLEKGSFCIIPHFDTQSNFNIRYALSMTE